MPTPTDLLNANRPDSLHEVQELLNRARRDGITYFPSPIDWRDQVLYFLLPDRFSDGNEASRSLLTRDEIRDLRRAQSRPSWNWKAWADSGRRWQGGTIKGIAGQLDYLQELGITTIWVGPVFKQRVRLDTYHGYGIQDFLEVDPRFGTRRNLIDLVSAAHSKQMRIILDIIVNHSGDNWGYVPPNRPVSDGNPLRLEQLRTVRDDPGKKAIACYRLWRKDKAEMMLRFVQERPVSDVTCTFLAWVCPILAQEGKRVLVLGWDNATWHTSQKVRQWIRNHNAKAKRTGGLRLLVCRLPVKSPWLNPIEPKWVHSKRAIIEPDRKLTAHELKTRICDYFNCPLLKSLTKEVA